MENRRPLRSKPVPQSMRNGVGGEDFDVARARDQTPLPLEEDWSSLGSTRVVPPDAGGNANTALQAEDTALPDPTSVPQATEALEFTDFKLLKKLGEGAMGVVYLAHQVSFDRQVALKILFKHVCTNPKLVQRMYQEGNVLGDLDHANIIRGYAVGEEHGYHFVAMEFVDGESLQKWLTRVGRLSVGDALHIILACARALEYAHGAKLVHRDIKPDNILITRAGDIKVADLGMVKKLDDDMSLTATGHAVGTPWYMPLEQARNAKETDGRCDIYALGCMLYCLLTGRPPFTGHTLVEVIQAKEKGIFAPARKVNADVPERLDLIIAKMAAKTARERYQSCTEVINALEGLQLANDKLALLSATAVPATGKKPAQPILPTVATTLSQPGSDDVKTADIWYLRYHGSDGRAVVRKVTAVQVARLAAAPNFDVTAKISRQPKDGFRALGTYKEFEHLVLGKLSKDAADQNTVRYRNLYKKIEEQERKREHKAEKSTSTFSYWLAIFIRVGGIGAAVGLLAWLLWYFGNGLGK